MDALILAGGAAPPDLQAATGCDDRACVPLEDVPLVLRVLAALEGTLEIDDITVVCNDGARDLIKAQNAGIRLVQAEGKMIDNLRRGLELTRSEHVLICTCDIPLVRSETFSRVLAEAARRSLAVTYPVVTRAACEAAFPGGTRTYARLDGREFTGGNAVVVPRVLIERATPLIDAAYNARKNPLALAKLLGPAFIMRFVTKKLGIEETERKLSNLLNCRVGAVILEDESDAAIAFDVDKLKDLETAARVLAAPKEQRNP
jgi:GTP:adenosylcobinamide-phosphate guanylyltransferase